MSTRPIFEELKSWFQSNKLNNIKISLNLSVGVGTCFKKYASHLLLQNIVGASAGALVATLLLLDKPMGKERNDYFKSLRFEQLVRIKNNNFIIAFSLVDFVASEFFNVVAAARNHSLGPFSPSFDIQKVLTRLLRQHLPLDAHKIVSGRLHISLTRIYDGKNVVVSQFNSREDLIDALSCSFFIPGFSGIYPPKFHGVRYMDGAFSDNLVSLDEDTVTVSPFCGESDICPRDETESKFYVSSKLSSFEKGFL